MKIARRTATFYQHSLLANEVAVNKSMDFDSPVVEILGFVVSRANLQENKLLH
jgi:hypothetical protein